MRHVEGWAREAFLAYADPDRPLDSALASAHIGAFHAFLATAVAREILGLAPQAALGLSMGESNMLAAMGAWEEPSGVMSALIQSGFYSDVAANYSAVAQSWKLAPDESIDWQNWWVRAPAKEARAALDGLDRAYLLIVMSPESCVIDGDAAACATYAQRIGLHRMVLTDNKAALHCSAAQPLAAAYRQAHLSKLRKIPGVRFYFSAVQGAVDLEENVVADLLARQAVECVDLRPTVLRAYADGVRVFVEIGPRAAISESISDILGERRPLSLSLDQKGAKPLVALTRAAASLFAAGVKIDLRLLAERLATLRGDVTAKPAQGDQKLRLPVHLQEVGRGLAAVSIDDEDVRRTEIASATSGRPSTPPCWRAATDTRCFARRFGVRLVPDWPLNEQRPLAPSVAPKGIVSPTGDVPGDFESLLATATGKPSDAFGALYRPFDEGLRVARLPSPPCHFMSEVVFVDCPPGVPTPGGKVVVDYRPPADAWYFRDGGNGEMPFAVLMETVLQPCGWLASYMGFSKASVSFRNLDGSRATIDQPVTAHTGALRTTVTFERYAAAGPTTIVFFSLVCECGSGRVMTLETSFGYFSSDALANQKGLPVSTAHRARLEAPSEISDQLDAASQLRREGRPALPGGRFNLIYGVTGFWPRGGATGLGAIRGRQKIDPRAWYFKAHFFQDPYSRARSDSKT